MDNPGAKPLYAEVTRAAIFGLVVNLALGVIKAIAGLLSGSLALASDAVNSLGDAVATIVVLIGLRIAQAPPDDEHPYGHTRAESIAASNVALLIGMSALWIGGEALASLGKERPEPPLWTLAIAGGNVFIKELLFRYKRAVGRRTGSAAILANAWDHRSDALCSAAVLVGLAIARIGGPEWRWADIAASLVVVGAILVAALQLYRRSAAELLDIRPEEIWFQRIREAANQVPGVAAVEKLRLRKSGLEIFADIHIQVPGDESVEVAHRTAHRVKDHLLETFPPLRDVLVHIEPL